MPSNDPTALIILSEIVLAETTIIIVYTLFSIIKKRSRSKYLSEMLTKVSDNKDSRKSSLKAIFKSISGLSEEKLNEITEGITLKEQEYYQSLANVLHSNKTSLYGDIVDSVNQLVKPYEMLVSGSSSGNTGNKTEAESKDYNVDSAIDELLEDADADPSLDISNTSEIEEIPDDLLEEK